MFQAFARVSEKKCELRKSSLDPPYVFFLLLFGAIILYRNTVQEYCTGDGPYGAHRINVLHHIMLSLQTNT